MTTPHDFGSVLGKPLDTSFGLSQFHGHGSWLMCEVALRLIIAPLNIIFLVTDVVCLAQY